MRTTSIPCVYAHGSRWIAVCREDGRQRKESVATFAAARELKVRRDAADAPIDTPRCERRLARMSHQLAEEVLPVYDVSDAVAAVVEADSETTWRTLLDAGSRSLTSANAVARGSPTQRPRRSSNSIAGPVDPALSRLPQRESPC
jgi:hypothetical protein